MSTLTTRGKAAVVLAFVCAATLFGVAAVALVKTSEHNRTPLSLPTGQPTPASASPTATPTPTSTPTSDATAKATPSASPSPTAVRVSPSPTRTTSSRPAPRPTQSSGSGQMPDGLRADATVSPASGTTTTATVFHLAAHATDGSGTIAPFVVTWGDGTTSTKAGTVCVHPAGGDCRDVALTHTFAHDGTYDISIRVTSGNETSLLHIQVCVAVCASPSPAART